MTDPTVKRFRLRSKKLFLTYPRCPLEPEEAVAQLLAVVSATGHVVAVEEHADGGRHLHAYLEADEPMTVDSASALDLKSGDGSTYHGNYQSVRSRSAVLKYVTKDGKYVTNVDVSPAGSNPWKRARELAAAEGLQAALSSLEEEPKTARDLCLNGDRIAKNLSSMGRKKLKITFGISTFGWNEPWDGSTQTLLLYGATNLGKTALAKALLPDALLIRHLDKLRDYASGYYSGIIFDDMSFGHLHREAQIAILDRGEDTQVHVRYSVAEIPAGTPVIVTTNRQPGGVFTTEDPAIARRLYIVHMKGIGQYFKQ